MVADLEREVNAVTQLYKLRTPVLLFMTSGTIIETVKDAIAVASTIIESAEKEVYWLVPAPLLVLAAQFNLNDKSRALMQKGGHERGITEISSFYVEAVSTLIDIGVDIRHMNGTVGRLWW